MADRERIAESYSDTNVLFHLLRHVGWGDLVNVGYYTVPTLHHGVGGLGWFQRELVRRSLDLLDAEPGDRVLDACCGRGLSTAVLGRRGCTAVGVDVQPEQIAEARRRFGSRPGAEFTVADVTALPAELGVFDRVHCLEAAFHFGPDGRAAFLAEAFRVLRPGGRLVLVDFTWRSPDPSTIAAVDRHGLVRSAWCFDEVEPRDRYPVRAEEVGFTVTAVHDWTRPVLELPMSLAGVVRAAVRSRVGRRALRLRWPGLRELTPADWRGVEESLEAHLAWARACHYTAFVLDKP
ncbi:class I SAM-dependent methyltransferase [Saccharothrix variisporea]|uniref:Methyltransferase family protein n=1 Tax=Saccharothrix variisporea TaxID=543527 RepID=A0A495WZK5_9PSEU|nr:class I SAM-dependent methyltransferase [Saccharothrix variisporea]RKT67050.1 methyltransferase family protein [Saccharothrix variisporea]